MMTIRMVHARKVYRVEVMKGERMSFRVWARLVYSGDGAIELRGKLARIV